MPSLPPFRASARDLADATVLQQWRTFTTPKGAVLLFGFAGTKVIIDLALAIDANAGWARIPGDWLVLGEPARERVPASIDWNERLRQDPLPNDAEGMIAWARRNLLEQ